MADYMREALVALMGKEALDGEQDTLSYWDETVCRDYLCGLCPYDLFVNTKSDVGTCSKIHSDRLKDKYESDFNAGKVDYLPAHLRNFKRLIDDCDRKASGMKRKLEEAVKSPRVMALLDDLQQNKATINAFTARVKELALESRMSEAFILLEELDRLNSARVQMENELKYLTNDPTNSGYQRLKICNVCAAYLSSIDSDRRLTDHFIGKTHMGFRKLRDEIERLTPIVASKSHRSSFSDASSWSENRSRHGYRAHSPPRYRESSRDRDNEWRSRKRDRDYEYKKNDQFNSSWHRDKRY